MQRLTALKIPWPAPSFFRSRPLMCGALGFAAGIMVSRALGYTHWYWAMAILFVALAVLLRKRIVPAACFLLSALFVFGLARGGQDLHAPTFPATGQWHVEGVITGRTTRNDRAVMFWLKDARVQISGEAEWRPLDGNLYCYAPTTTPRNLVYGQRIAISGNSYLPSDPRNPGGFDQRMWMAQNGAHVRLYGSSTPKILAEPSWSLYGLADGINRSLGVRMDRLFGQASPIIRAMLLGDQSSMPDEWSTWMSNSGISHLLAVSGLHVALWFALLERLLRPLPMPPGIRWLLLALILAAYSLITGLKPSVLRASIMLLTTQGSFVVRRRSDTLTSLSLAALCILLFRPLDLFGAGFQLSFCAVLGIVLLRPVFLHIFSPLKKEGLIDALSTTTTAQLGILPAATHWFGTTSFLGALINLLAIPLTGLLIPVSALAVALDAIWSPLGFLFLQASRGMAAVLVLMSRLAAGMPLAFMRIGAFAWWTAICFFVCMLLCCTAVVWPWSKRFIAMGVAIAAAFCTGFFHGSFQVRYVQLDVGQALSGVLHAGTKTYVYDTGDTGSDLTEYLLYTGSTVEGMFLSHPHRDHVGGLTEVLETGIPIRTIYVPANADAFGADPEYADQLLAAQSYGIEIIEVSSGDVLDLNGIETTVVAPPYEATRGSDPNDRSIILHIAIDDYTILLTGDADGAAEPLGIDVDVLQVAHHGSRQAARTVFLQDTTPDVALISVGRNYYGHPHEETLQRLDDFNVETYITQETGAITLYFWPNRIQVEAFIQ